MNFSTMSAAERMKASGLIGLIVVILFFVVHTMLGALAPKSATPTVNPGGTTAPDQNTAQAAPMASTKAVTGQEFPLPASPPRRTGVDAGLTQNMDDPFVPLNGADKAESADTSTKESSKASSVPSLDVQPASTPKPEPQSLFADQTPASAGKFTLPPFNTGPATLPTGIASISASAAPEPEIRVVGVVSGEPSLATLEVMGQVRIVRPGDPLAKGWRLASVDSEGVRLRHGKEMIPLHVGALINEARIQKKD